MIRNKNSWLLLPAPLLALGLGIALLSPEPKSEAGGGGGDTAHKLDWPMKNPVWSLYWVAPQDSTSPHGDGSGLELRHVFYKGKRVFWQAHVPCVNVLYDQGTTYRDWVSQYAPFQFNPATPNIPPKTMCDHPLTDDQGTFTGVAVENRADRLILTTQVRAGWYRYVQTWTFYPNGVIEPRFMFTASNSNPDMVKQPHNHHAYFRFDFDIDGWPNDVIEYFNSTDNKWHIIGKETNQRHSKTSTKWRVRDKGKNIGYEVIPSVEDHTIQDAWSVADIWGLHYHPDELDDATGGHHSGTDPAGNQAHMNNQMNGENLDGQDIVLWYRVGHRHAGASACGQAGPTLRPFGNW